MENSKKKSLFKGIQFALSILINTFLFYELKQNFLEDDILLRILQIFGIVMVSVFASNMVALLLIRCIFKIASAKQFLTTENSYGKFFSITIIYSLVSSIFFSFGVFSILYSAFGDGTLVTLLLWYALFYFIIEFFSYGLVAWAFMLSQGLKKQRGDD